MNDELIQASLVLTEDAWEIVMRALRREYRGEVTQNSKPTPKTEALEKALIQLDTFATPTVPHEATRTWRVAP